MTLRLGRLDAALLLAALAFLAVGVSLDWSWLHPGYAAYDDEALLCQVQAFREGHGLFWSLGAGSLSRALAVGLDSAFGPSLAALQAGPLLLVCAETLLLLAWGARLGRPELGLWAALLNLASPHTWVRSRSLLSFAAVPLQLLLALWFLPRRGAGPLRAGLTGAALALLALDYELWAWGLPLLALAWALCWRPTQSELWAGLGSGLAALTALAAFSGFDPAAYWQVRSAQTFHSAGWGQGLAALFVPAEGVLPFLGAGGSAWAAPWLWILAAWGWWKAGWARPWLGLFIAAGLLPALLAGTAREPQRLLLAWPLLCAAGALGVGALARGPAWRGQALSAGLALLLIPAWTAFQRSQADGYLQTYGAAANRLAAVRALRNAAKDRPLRVLSDLDTAQGLLLRYHLAEAGVVQAADGALVAPAGWDLFPQGWDPAWGRWLNAAAVPAVPDQAWLFPAPGRAAALEADAALLRDYWPKAVGARGALRAREEVEAALARRPGAWARSVLALRWMSAARDLDELPETGLQALLQGPLMGGAFHHEAAEFLRHRRPEQALALVKEACRRDPRRLEAWQLWQDLLLSFGQRDEAERVRGLLRARLRAPAGP